MWSAADSRITEMFHISTWDQYSPSNDQVLDTWTFYQVLSTLQVPSTYPSTWDLYMH